jgi:ribosomal-protein-alanine N-acetyltransferase
MLFLSPPYFIRSMHVDDLPDVMRNETAAYTTPWVEEGYRNELTQNKQAHYYVAGRHMSIQDELIGHAGYWLIHDEAHVSTIAIHPEWQNRGLGRLLLWHNLTEIMKHPIILITLEVRESNEYAQRLYSRFGFEQVGRRKRYYSDNGEDALLMSIDPRQGNYHMVLDEQKATLGAYI